VATLRKSRWPSRPALKLSSEEGALARRRLGREVLTQALGYAGHAQCFQRNRGGRAVKFRVATARKLMISRPLPRGSRRMRCGGAPEHRSPPPLT
jgi:hypothetical protein